MLPNPKLFVRFVQRKKQTQVQIRNQTYKFQSTTKSMPQIQTLAQIQDTNPNLTNKPRSQIQTQI